MADFLDFDPENDEIINREVIEHEEPATDRSFARRVALQVLYEIDSSNHSVDDVLAVHLLVNPEPRKVKGYITKLVQGIVDQQQKIDAILQSFAAEWPIDQVAVIDRNILRIALFEMALDDRTPVGVAIDEAIELAKLFGAENTPRFINGVLGTVADNLSAVRKNLALNSTESDHD